jgi:hypothetical protein
MLAPLSGYSRQVPCRAASSFKKHVGEKRATCFKTGVRLSAEVRGFSFLHILQIDPGAHRASCHVGTAESGLKLTTRLHPVSSSRTLQLYLHSLIRLHGLVLSLRRCKLKPEGRGFEIR